MWGGGYLIKLNVEVFRGDGIYVRYYVFYLKEI